MYQIRKVYSLKGRTFCLSTFQGDAFWSVHNGVFDLATAKRTFQRHHDEQVYSLIQEKRKPQPETI